MPLLSEEDQSDLKAVVDRLSKTKDDGTYQNYLEKAAETSRSWIIEKQVGL